MATERLLKVEENISAIKTDVAVMKEKQDAFNNTAKRIEGKVNEIFASLPTKADMHYVEKLEEIICDKADADVVKSNTDAIKWIIIFALTQIVTLAIVFFNLWADKI